MIRFGPDESRKSRRLVRSGGRVWHLVVMLVVTLGLMFASWHMASRREVAEEPIPDESGTSRVSAPESEEGFPESLEPEAVELDRLSEFRDHSRNLEPDPYYYLLDLARRNPSKWMEEHARRDVTWAQLLRDPDKYRGQLLFLSGRLRRLVVDECGANDYGLTQRYEGWLFTADSGQHPYAVIVTQPPRGMPVGAIFENVTVAGYFLGWWRHQNQLDKPTSSPVILAHRFRWIEQPAVSAESPSAVPFGLAIGAAIVLAAGVVVWYTTMRKSPKSPAPPTELFVFQENPPPDSAQG